MNNGIKVGVVSGGDSKAVRKRFTENLKVDFWFLGNLDKRGAYLEILQMGYTDEEILFMGDDIPDLEVLQTCGLPCCPSDAAPEVKAASMYISHKNGGYGCGRDVVEQVMKAQGKWMNGEAFGW
jgi:3-deoxy-D-manno-octulosonate 8-phosphate phosphatase (KDO 8-P phosphatase)